MTVTVQSGSNIAKFNVEIWKLNTSGARLSALTPQPETDLENQKGVYVYAIPELDLTVNGRLALIITG